MTMISLFRMIELVGQKVLAAALIVGLSLGFGFLPAVLAKKYLQHSQKKYSVSSLVVPKMEEGISGTGAVKNSK